MKTRITELLGIEYPVFQGAMAWIANGHLAAAVSEAGGLGIIAGGAAPVEVIRQEIHTARALTKKPLGLNIMLLSPNADDLAKLAVEEKIEVITTGAGNPGKYLQTGRLQTLKSFRSLHRLHWQSAWSALVQTPSSLKVWSPAVTSVRPPRWLCCRRLSTQSAFR